MAKKMLKTEKNTSMVLTLFNVGDILCGVSTSHVRGIIKHFEITDVPGAPEYVRGVLNLRGRIVTIIDLRKKFGLESLAISHKMGIVVVSSEGEDIGLLVDVVEDVVTADSKHLKPPPSNIGEVTGRFFSHILKMKKERIALLNLDQLLKSEIGFLGQAGGH
jgi:purine-binding chemotaxis protein CheW